VGVAHQGFGPAGVYDIGDYEVTSSLESVQTAKIQRAIDDVAAKKGVLYVPPGLLPKRRVEDEE